MNRAVYTAIIGAYDTLKEPTVITPGWGYICFTDQKHLRSTVWRIVQIRGMTEWPTLEKLDPIRKARYIKILGYQWIDSDTIWVDASFQIACNLEEWWEYSGAKSADMVVIKHPMRNCVYAEGATCIRNKRGDEVEIQKQLNYYRDQKIPEESQTLIQSGILMRKQTDDVSRMCWIWWSQVERFSTRDQLGFVYAELAGSSIALDLHIMQNFDYRTSTKFLFSKHLKKVLNHTDVLMYLATKLGAKTYLEIGVQNPNNNFNNIPVQFKVGVDPDPHANATFRGTSDEYFDGNHLTGFDLIFIDGLHHRDQVKKDFINAHKSLSDNGFIVIHDCNPQRPEITYTPRNGLRGEWTGDVYNFVAFELWEYPVKFVTLPFDQGICIVWKDQSVAEGSKTMTTSWEYFDSHRRELLHIIDNIEEFDKLWN